MPFGLASAPEVFQQVMSSLIADVKNAEVSMDDVLLHATSKLELERITQEVLDKFKIAGLKLNKEKCVFNTQEVKFLGHIVSAEGVKPDPEKIETITKIKQPENVKELQRFLGMVTYVSKFIKNLADITQPLRQLLRKDVEWVWDTQHNEAFNKLKNLLKNPPVLGYYDTKAPILLSVDASSYACGGVLIQKQKPIAYCAKSFTKTEQDMYIWGCKDLTIESDHKPLKTIFKKPITDAPPRLQRIMYQILPYNPKVTYKKGTELYVADFLSRDCENLDGEDLNTENLQICAIVPFTKTRKDELKAETAKSKELNDLKLIILKGWPDTINKVPVNLKKYWYYREALSVYEDIIFKDHRVLVPNTMVPLVMKHCHLSHKGLQGTLKLARDNIFWPTMTKDLTEYIKTCGACSKIQKDNQMEQINLQAAPKRPWSIVASDIFHLRGKDCLLIADSYSGYFDFKQLNNITSFNVIKEFKTWFATFGIPEVLLSDGGKQFDCSEFRAFQKEWNFEHRISSPHFPRSNGLAERYVQEAKNLMKKCLEDNTDIHLALLHHRNTPRLDLGSPVQRLMNRRTRTLLPTNEKLLNPKIIKNVSKKLTKLKEGEKGTADRNKKQSREYTTQEKVLLRQSHNNWVPAYIVRPEGHRSYRVQTEDGATYRRNTWHLKPATSSLDVNPNSSTDRPTVEPKIQSPSSPTQPPTETTTQQCSPDDVPLEAEPSTPATRQDAASLNHPPRTRCGRGNLLAANKDDDDDEDEGDEEDNDDNDDNDKEDDDSNENDDENKVDEGNEYGDIGNKNKDECFESCCDVNIAGGSNNVQEGVRQVYVQQQRVAITFRDIGDTIRPYDGSEIFPIQSWINEFEKVAALMQCNDFQRLIYAKKSLKGLAKTFINSERGKPTLQSTSVCLVGFGDSNRENQIKPMGSVKHEITIDGEKYSLNFMVVPSRYLNVDILLGEDFCAQATITISAHGLSIKKTEKDVSEDVLELLKIDILNEKPLNIDENASICAQNTIRDCIGNYKPMNCKSTNVVINIILKDETPVYSMPRRLPLAERHKVD
ncbi:PREDICTED: uncharacterized protein LOC108375524 [Rhagoletis zephyria]|uniref:uncharacterized protein LOC108375524 n=1 Tax=Rhagoletis zephyria TaxID=28612 RepID=UPI00081143BC|nr:PREDICTED: uncharacterized protein LOC108375524 [Rhagoletis zephyria]